MTERAEELLRAVRDDDAELAKRLLSEVPALAEFNIFTAAATGSSPVVARLISGDAAQARLTHTREEWTPLAYACRTRIRESNASAARDVVQIAATLVDAGASMDRSSVWFEADGRAMPIPALYHACMSDHPALAALLLERGATPNDGESVYHAAQYNRQACLEVLLAHGADLSGRQQPYGNTPLYFLVGHESDGNGEAAWFKGLVWLLEHGADPNVPSYAKREAPLHGIAAGLPKLATVRQLLAHGADVNLPRGDGRTPYAVAVRSGNTALAALLLEHGADASRVTPADEFLGACLAADEARARALLARWPDIPQSLHTEDGSAFAGAVFHDNPAAIRVMVALGFPLDANVWNGGTPLHAAAWLGRVDLVRLLIEMGAPLDVRDRQFGSSAVGWAAHGSGCHSDREDDYLAIVETLLAAGADRAASINKSGEAPETMASPRVAKRLEAWARSTRK